MANAESIPHLSDTIEYDRDIAPYQFIKIFSGVGSGKNGFVDRLVMGGKFTHADGTPVKKQHLLLITSRRSKVDEQLNSDIAVYDPTIGMFDDPANDWMMDDFDEPEYAWKDDPAGWGKIPIQKRTCVNTNAKVEHNIQNHYHPFDIRSHPWERFDIIVVDEIHSLMADASYQSSPFYIRRLIEESLKRSKTCKVIVMTGTPQVLENDPLFDKAYCIDRMNVCINIKPKRIEFIDKETSIQLQRDMLVKKQAFISFFSHIGDMSAVTADMEAEPLHGVVRSFSDVKKREKMASENNSQFLRMCRTEKHLALHQKLPDNVLAFLTTSRNKEGVNINNENFHTMFVESHIEIDVIQMAGRLRNPIDVLYVVTDSQPFHDMENSWEKLFSEYIDTLNAANSFFQQLCQDAGIILDDNPDNSFHPPVHEVEQLGSFIDYIHAKFPYIRYDYFTDKFCYYKDREKSKAYNANQNRKFAIAKQSEQGLIDIANQWFPSVPCIVQVNTVQDIQKAIDDYLVNNNWLNGQRTIFDAQRKEILFAINQIAGTTSSQLKSLLKQYGYHLDTRGKKKTSPSIITKIPKGEL